MNSIAKKTSLWNRTRKYRYFKNNVQFTSKTTVLDVGFSNKERDYPAMNYLEKHYPYPQKITALGINGKDVFCRNYPLVRAVLYDGVNFPFGDKQFDIGWSNAVIEHVAKGGGSRATPFFKRVVADMQGGMLYHTQQTFSYRTAYPTSLFALASAKYLRPNLE